MAAGVTTKGAQEARHAALAQLRERDWQIAHLADLVAQAEAAHAARAARPPAAAPAASAPASAPAVPPAPPAPPPDPAAVARAAVDADLRALAIYARHPGGPENGSRRFWMDAIDRLGRHLAPDGTPAIQRAAALGDERGAAFVEARQQCRT